MITKKRGRARPAPPPESASDLYAYVVGPTYYLSENFELPKCWTSKSHMQAVQHQIAPHTDGWYIFFTYTRTYLSSILSNGYHVNFGDLGVILEMSTFCIIFPTYLQTSNSLLEFSLTEFLRGFFPVYFLLGLRKRDTGKKARKKMFPQTQSKISLPVVF